MLRALYAHVTRVMADRTAPDIRDLIHPQAEMRLFVSFGRLLRGRAAVVEALERGRAAVLFRTTVDRIAWLDDLTTLTFGHACYALENGDSAEGDVCWLGEFRDGMVWRVNAFTTEAAARQNYARLSRDRLDTTTPRPM